MAMDLYERQLIQRRWLEAARGDVRVLEEAVKKANKLAAQSSQRVTSEMVIEQIKDITKEYA